MEQQNRFTETLIKNFRANPQVCGQLNDAEIDKIEAAVRKGNQEVIYFLRAALNTSKVDINLDPNQLKDILNN